MAEIREVRTVNTAGDVSCGLKPQKLSCQHQWWRGLDFLEGQRSCWPDVVTCAKVKESDPKLRILANVHLISVRTHRFDCHPTNAVKITMRQKIVMQV